MDWDNLKYFLALAETGSLSRASEKLRVDHSTIARRIEMLEQDLGIHLVERLSRCYRLTVDGDASGTAQLTLSTLEGALQLTGSGTAGANGVRFRGEARAASGDDAALSNLLNIIGRREGARSVISIG
jgi:DNA-binding transcriptional LysR family regulator